MEEWKLTNNYIGDVGLLAFSDVIRLNTKLKVLSLAGNGIRNAGCDVLCECLMKHPSIEVLDLSDNAGITRASEDVLVFSLSLDSMF